MTTTAIIQARMGSSRLPGKVLMPLAGKPVLWHIVHRLRKCQTVDSIALAITTKPEDDFLQEFGETEGVAVIRGSEENVLERYYIAAKELHADIIVRVTGDAPLIDPAFLDQLVVTLIKKKVDSVRGDPAIPCIHEGFSPFTFNALQKLITEAGDDPVAREHVDAYFKCHPDFVPIAVISPSQEYRFSGARLSVDTPADLRFLEAIYRRLQVPPGEADVRDVVMLLRQEPDFLKINAHVYQKKADEPTRRILFRCDADTPVGFASITRCLALADVLRDTYGYGVTFTKALGSQGFEIVCKSGFSVELLVLEDEEKSFEKMINRLTPDVIVLGCRSQFNLESIKKWQDRKILIVCIDESMESSHVIDLAVHAGVKDDEIARKIQVLLGDKSYHMLRT